LLSASIGGLFSLLSVFKGFPQKHEVDMEEMKKAQEKEEKDSKI
jgi:hypothetical protein